jgi:hypothetical protein
MSSFYQQTAEEAARIVNMRQSRAAQGRRYNSGPYRSLVPSCQSLAWFSVACHNSSTPTRSATKRNRLIKYDQHSTECINLLHYKL